MNTLRSVFGIRVIVILALVAATTATTAIAADKASGTVAQAPASTQIKYAWMVRGPDEMDPSHTVLRIYLSSVDIGAKIKACKSLSCADQALEDGAMVDFSDARHLGYAVRLDHERVQYSGGTDQGAFTLSINKPDHLAGKLHIDDSAFNGARVDAQFDVTLANTFKTVL
ncbi:MAG: hypothetical protein WBV61_00935 [Rhodanobacteraceae bacterium]